MKTIRIATDFSDTPLGRYPSDGGFSGERFREEVLVPALSSNEKVVVNLDEVEGYGSSFLEESFGGLVRKCGYTETSLKSKLEIQCCEDYRLYRDLIWKYIHDAKPSAA